MMNPEILQQWRGNTIILTAPGQLNHRAITIQIACDLEAYLSELLSAFFVSQNPLVSHKNALSELYSEGRVLSSLKKMADVALYLGLISEEQRYDLKSLSKLRDRYAHDRHRKQLYEEPELFALITRTNLYKNNRSDLNGFDQQAILMCIKEQLIFDLKARLRSINTSTSQVSDA